MIREIKFRCWHNPTQKMYDVYGFDNDNVYIDTLDSPEPGVNIFPRQECALIQFTGHYGFGKKELYEDDIVFYEEEEETVDKRYYLVIIWIHEWSMFASLQVDEYLKYRENGAESLDEFMFWTYTLEESEHYHYAGNIHQNPGLL